MYIKKIKIENIRSIREFEMTFDQPAGWHVLIGDNGSGKSAIIKSVSLALLDTTSMNAANFDWNDWLRYTTDLGSIDLLVQPDFRYDGFNGPNEVTNRIDFERVLINKRQTSRIKAFSYRNEQVVRSQDESTVTTTSSAPPTTLAPTPTPVPSVSTKNAWFSAAYGPLRRFKGGDQFQEEEFYKRYPKLGAHLTVFKEDYALSQADKYIRDLFVSGKADENPDADAALNGIKLFFNNSDLLPHGTTMDDIKSKELFFKDPNGNQIKLSEMSDGYRSVLSLMFELMRQLIFSYGVSLVFSKINQTIPVIDLPGVVLIDEVDAHLHPTWQTKIGQWFTKYFPNIQFIVTTHSPLVCRAAEKGSIWQLPIPGTDDPVRKIDGVKRNRLIYGNILDAYGTGLFGDDTPLSESANDKLNELADLNVKSMFGQITPSEEQRLVELKSIFSTQG